MLKIGLKAKLEKLDMLNSSDREEIQQWNTPMTEPVEQCVHSLFDSQVQSQPAAPAVEASDGYATYGELDKTSTRLAHELRRQGVETGNPVVFIFEKSLYAIVAILAIVKAGGACVPIDKDDPKARKASIVSTANAKVVLTSNAEYENSIDLAPTVINVGDESITALEEVHEPLDSGITPQDLAYFIFTSGMPFGRREIR